MTRKKQKRRLAAMVSILLALVALALVAKLRDDNSTLAKLYDFIKDTSLLVATVAVAYLASVYQKRDQFLQSLREQWRETVQAKTALMIYCQKDAPTLDDYLAASQQLSECIDNMRIVYSNVGETDELIGLFPYAPLHHMRVTLEGLDPRRRAPSASDREAALAEISSAFAAIREHFLDEFDIEEPARPILIYGMKRTKKPGAAAHARRLHDKQLAAMSRAAAADNGA